MSSRTLPHKKKQMKNYKKLFEELTDEQQEIFIEWVECTMFYEAHDCDEQDNLDSIKSQFFNI